MTLHYCVIRFLCSEGTNYLHCQWSVGLRRILLTFTTCKNFKIQIYMSTFCRPKKIIPKSVKSVTQYNQLSLGNAKMKWEKLVFLMIKCTNHYALPCCIISALLERMVKLLRQSISPLRSLCYHRPKQDILNKNSRIPVFKVLKIKQIKG